MALVAVLAFARSARGDEFLDARHLSANPDIPATVLVWRDHLRGAVGLDIPVFQTGGRDQIELRIPVMVELSNIVDNVIPNNYWRGLLGIELGYRFSAVGPHGEDLRLALFLQHESDHETVDLVRYFQGPVTNTDAPVGFYEFNSVGLRGDLPFHLRGQNFAVAATAKLHVLSCNVNLILCASGADGWGSQTFEGSGEVSWSGWAPASDTGRLMPFVSLYADWLAPNGLVREEHRVVANLGVWIRTATRGTLVLFGIAWFGNDVGYLRDQRVTQVGGGLRWTP
jgi:hypothetical protein